VHRAWRAGNAAAGRPSVDGRSHLPFRSPIRQLDPEPRTASCDYPKERPKGGVALALLDPRDVSLGHAGTRCELALAETGCLTHLDEGELVAEVLLPRLEFRPSSGLCGFLAQF
jgi:hypothetical protein